MPQNFWEVRSRKENQQAQSALFQQYAASRAQQVQDYHAAQDQQYAQGVYNNNSDQFQTWAQQRAQQEDEKNDGGLFGGAFHKLTSGGLTALSAVGDVFSRPNYASAAFTDATIDLFNGKDTNPFVAAWEGLSGKKKITYGDVLEKHGVDNPWVRGIAGFGMDILLDPTTYITFGAGGGLKAVLDDGTRVTASALGRKAAMDEVAKAGLKFGDEGAQDIIKQVLASDARYLDKGGIGVTVPFVGKAGTLVPGSAFTPLARFRTAMGEAPGIRDLKETAGRMFVYQHSLGKVPNGDQLAQELGNLERYPQIAKSEAAQRAQAMFGKLSPEERVQAGVMLSVPVDELSQPWGSRYFEIAGVAPPEMAWQGGRAPYYHGTAAPEFQQLQEGSWLTPDLAEAQMRADLSANVRTQRGQPVGRKRVLAVGGENVREDSFSVARQKGWRRTTEPVTPQDVYVQQLQNKGLQDAIDAYTGTYRPEYDALSADLGIKTALPDYLRMTVDKYVAEDWKNLGIGRPIRARKSKSAITRTTWEIAEDIKGGKTVGKQFQPIADAYRAGQYPTDTLLNFAIDKQKGAQFDAMISVAMEKAEKDIVRETNRFVQHTADNYMTKLDEGAMVPEGMATYAVKDGTGKVIGNYAAPPEVVDALRRTFEPRETNAFLHMYDNVQAAWKATVTSIFPEFHARNALGNVQLNWLGGITNPMNYVVAGRMQKFPNATNIIHTVEGDITEGALHDELVKRGIMAAGQFSETELGLVPNQFDNLLQKHGSRISNIVSSPFRAGRTVGHAIENNARVAHVVGKLEQGYTLDDAVLSAKKYLFDYGELTDFEKGVMRRVIPFYTFMRKNIPVQMEAILKQPGKQAAVFKGLDEAEDKTVTAAEKAILPQYMLEQLNVVVGRDGDGNPLIIRGTGLPIEQLNLLYAGTPRRTLERLFGQASPILTTPLQVWTGKSLFTGKEITDPSYQNYYRKTNAVVSAIPGLSDWLQVEQKQIEGADGKMHTVYNANPFRMFLATAVIGRMMTTAGQATSLLPGTEETGGGIGSWVLKGLDAGTGLKAGSLNLARTTGRSSAERDALYASTVIPRTNADLRDISAALLSGEITPEQWRAARKEYMSERSMLFDQMEEKWLKDEARPGLSNAEREQFRSLILSPEEKAYQAYTSLSPDDFVGPDGLPDMNAFMQKREEMLASLSPAQQQMVLKTQADRIEKLPEPYRTVEREYQQDLDTLQPWFDLTDREWKMYQAVNPMARQYTTYQQFLNAKTLELQASGRAGRVTAESLPEVKGFTRRLSRVKDQFLRRNPEIAALLVKWGYREKLATPSAQQYLTPIGGQ